MRHYNKLVRDKIPAMIQEHEEEPIYRKLQGEELEHRMQMKIQEEFNELLGARGTEDEIKEFADLYEILEAYRKRRGFTQVQIKEARKLKNKKRGSFKEAYFLASVRPKRTEEEIQKEQEALELMKRLQNPKHRKTIIKMSNGAEIVVPDGPKIVADAIKGNDEG